MYGNTTIHSFTYLCNGIRKTLASFAEAINDTLKRTIQRHLEREEAMCTEHYQALVPTGKAVVQVSKQLIGQLDQIRPATTNTALEPTEGKTTAPTGAETTTAMEMVPSMATASYDEAMTPAATIEGSQSIASNTSRSPKQNGHSRTTLPEITSTPWKDSAAPNTPAPPEGMKGETSTLSSITDVTGCSNDFSIGSSGP